MDRFEWHHAVIASAVLCLAVAVPLGLSANDPDAPPALLIPILAAGLFAMLWLCGFLAVLAVALPFGFWRSWRSPEAVERRARRAAAAREGRVRRTAENAARRTADPTPWWESLLVILAWILVAGGLVAGVVAIRIHWDHVGPVIKAASDWIDRNGWVLPLGLAVVFGPMLAFIAVDHIKKRRRSQVASIESRRKAQEAFDRVFSECPDCGERSFEVSRGRCFRVKCFGSIQRGRSAPPVATSHRKPADKTSFPMVSDPQNRWRRCANCGFQYAGVRDCPACARSSV